MRKFAMTSLVAVLLLVCYVLPRRRSSQPLTSYPQTETHNEPFYIKLIARQHKWQVGTRCDLVFDRYAVEVEWSRHSYKAVGRSLRCSLELERKPAILFLLSDRREREYVLERVGKVAERYDIEVLWYDTTLNMLLE